LIDHQARFAALCAAICAIFSLFGVIHSVLPTGELYLPWQCVSRGNVMLAAAYFALAGILLTLTGKEK
jgi:AGZA family xanthine/uracil permease-like MFS transporter